MLLPILTLSLEKEIILLEKVWKSLEFCIQKSVQTLKLLHCKWFELRSHIIGW